MIPYGVKLGMKPPRRNRQKFLPSLQIHTQTRFEQISDKATLKWKG